MLYETFLKSSTRSKFMPKYKHTSVECMVCKRDNSDGLVFDFVGYMSNHIEARNVSKIRNKIGCYSHNLYPVLASEHAHRLFYFFEKKLIIYIYYNLILLHFSITKYLEVWWKNNFTHKPIILVTPLGILWLENVVISNYNRCKLLIFFQKYRRAYEHARECVLRG